MSLWQYKVAIPGHKPFYTSPVYHTRAEVEKWLRQWAGYDVSIWQDGRQIEQRLSLPSLGLK